MGDQGLVWMRNANEKKNAENDLIGLGEDDAEDENGRRAGTGAMEKREREQVIIRTEQQIDEALEGGKQIRWGRYKDSTLHEMRRLWKQYESYRSTILACRAGTEEADIVAAWAYEKMSHRHNLPQTVQSDVCLIIDELRLRGVPYSTLAVNDLVKGLGRKRVPAVKANPMRFRQVVQIIRDERLDIFQRAYAALIWLSGQRPFHIMMFPMENMAIMDDGILLVYVNDSKFWGEQSTRDLRCKQLVLGPFENVLRRAYNEALREGRQTLLLPADRRELENYVRRMPVQTTHRLLRQTYTLYSLRRGAVQHLAASGCLPHEIATLTDHRSLGALAGYIGAYLAPESLASKTVSTYLTKFCEVPFEYPLGIQPQGRNEQPQRRNERRGEAIAVNPAQTAEGERNRTEAAGTTEVPPDTPTLYERVRNRERRATEFFSP